MTKEELQQAMKQAMDKHCQPYDWEFNDGFANGFLTGAEWAIKYVEEQYNNASGHYHS
jgi:hypothetical protein